MSSNLPRIHAHRGCSEQAPENTIPAFQMAIELGADGIEFDLHFTKDSGIVVHHDAYLGRTSNGEGLIAEHTLSDLASMDAGSWYGVEYAGTKIPQLHEMLSIANGSCVLEAQLSAISEPFIQSVLDSMELIGAQVAHLPCGRVNAETVRAFQGHGFLVHAADCNTEAEILNAISAGVNQLSTDELLLALEIRSNLGRS